MTDASPEPDWRPIIAALANPGTRRMFAEVVLGAEPEAIGGFLSASKRQHARAALLTAGLVADVDGRLVDGGDVYARVLAAAARPRRRGPERFLDGRGQIDRYPTDDDELRALLDLVAREVLAAGEVVAEKELNERLSRFDADTARLRRAMVDTEVLERTRSGSQYARVAAGA